jgi:hypothetical protein
VVAAVLELEARTGDQIADCTGNEDLTGPSEVCNPCSGMHGYATNVIVPDLNLAGMEAAAHFDPQRPKLLDDCGSAAHTAGWAIKSSKKAVAECFYLSSAEAC